MVRLGLAGRMVLASGTGEFAPTLPNPHSHPHSRRTKANMASDAVPMEVRRACRLLRHRLDRHAMARTVFAKLAIVERELVRHGYPAVRSLPVELLREALKQLNCVMGGRHGELETLRAKIFDAILIRESQNRGSANRLSLSVFEAPHQVEVVEGGESEFLLALAQVEFARPGAASGSTTARLAPADASRSTAARAAR